MAALGVLEQSGHTALLTKSHRQGGANLCDPCMELMTRILGQRSTAQHQLSLGDTYASKHGSYQDMKAACENGCKLCWLFCKALRSHSTKGQQTPDTLPVVEPTLIQVLLKQDAIVPCIELVDGGPGHLRVNMELFQPRADSTTASFARHIPSAVSRLPVSDTAVNKAREWLQRCRNQHTQCERKRSVVKLPLRVIDVGIEGSALRPKLKTTGLMLGEYATLSHCWGLSKRSTTTRANIEQHSTDGFCLANLPATFRDAILFTRLLRIRYLWIDALCIVQDDIGDWNRHAVLMHSIFSNAVISLSALDSPDSNSGFLGAREDQSVVLDIEEIAVGVRTKLHSTGDAIDNSILETRAWCFQERLLPPAVLHFGKAQLYWECLGAEASESLHEFGAVSQAAHPLEELNTLSSHNPGSWHTTWLSLVEQYSQRLITRPGDRLPALRGLAEHVKRTIPRIERGSYHYGIWAEYAYTSLLWQRTYDEYKQEPRTPAEITDTSREGCWTSQTKVDGNEDRAPSWSWASLNQPVNWTRVSQAARTSTSLDVKLDMHLPRVDSLLSGAVARWALGFEGCVLEGTCRLSTTSGGSHGLACFEVSENRGYDIVCVLDRADEFNFARCCAVYMSNFRIGLERSIPSECIEAFGEMTRTGSDLSTAFVLILEEARLAKYHDRVVYRRTGIGSGSSDMIHRLFALGERRTFVVY